MKSLLLKRRWRGAVYSVACLAIWFAWVLIFGLPRIGEIRSNRLELKEAEATFGQLSRVASTLPGQLAALQEEETALEHTLATLPREEEIPAVTRSFTERAVSHGLEVISADLEIGTIFGPSRERRNARISILPFRLVVRGRYGRIGRFLEETTDRKMYAGCESVEITRVPDAKGTVEATLSFKLYALAGPSTGGTCERGNEQSTAYAADPGPEKVRTINTGGNEG